MLKVEDWAEIRRLHRAERVPIKEIVRRLGVARNTVRAALSSDRPPTYRRISPGSVVDAYEPQIRALLREWPRMPAPEIAQRIGWPSSYSDGPLKKLLARIRPEYKGVDPVDRVTYEPGQLTQCDLWFPAPRIPVAIGQQRMLPVLVMTLAFSRFTAATMIPSRQAGDILSGMWALISGIGRVTRTLLWDRESAIGGTGRVIVPAAAFAGTSPPAAPLSLLSAFRACGAGRLAIDPATRSLRVVGDWLRRLHLTIFARATLSVHFSGSGSNMSCLLAPV